MDAMEPRETRLQESWLPGREVSIQQSRTAESEGTLWIFPRTIRSRVVDVLEVFTGEDFRNRQDLHDIRWLTDMLQRIEAAIWDAEESKMTSESGLLDLKRLKGIAHHVEDLLDEYESLDCKASEVRALSSGSSPNDFNAFRARLAESRANIESELNKIAFSKNLRINDHAQCSVGTIPCQPGSTSFIEPDGVIGRENDLMTVKKFLLAEIRPGAGGIQAMSIVGMKGLGKTALAQLSYNDD